MDQPTKNAVAGKFINRSSDDFFQFYDAEGNCVSWIDSTGQPQGNLSQVIVSLPTEIDIGTF